ncbi:bifunctional monothiol glutaredoxin-S16, chloroplastic [Selaginella moellendorffii]|nr:bifunctional monothiol glutaredoxin-S16, chloroplastic [Selaginella moellendorffii]|eukprot:XP_002982642.2 bifunctional monothiol glutaredoxin-S16, chloroplastic [Selaginella moellendorffii]
MAAGSIGFLSHCVPGIVSPAPRRSAHSIGEKQVLGLRFSASAGIRSKNPRRIARNIVCSSVRKLSEVESSSIVPEELSKIPAAQGVYAIYDKQGELQFVGMSRRISTSVQGHARDLPELCGAVKVAVVESANREELKQAWQAWVEEHIKATGSVPSGNSPGNTTWTAKKKAKNDLKMKPSRDKELTITLEELIGIVVKTHNVVAFIKGSRTAPQCGFSHRVLTILEQQGVDYETVNVLDEEHNSGVREAIKSYSQWPTIPQVFVKGEFVGGADVMSELAESGEISKLFAPLKK